MATSAQIDTSVWDAIFKRVKGADNLKIGVGVFGDEELATIAATHEYGSEHWHATGEGVPERSYIRSTLAEKKSQLDRVMKRVATGVMNGKFDVRTGLGIVGEWAVNAIKAKIRSNVPPPLKPATIAAKGSSKALIDTGRLLNSIEWKFVD